MIVRSSVSTVRRKAVSRGSTVDAKNLATGLLAAVEGGYLLSQTGRDPRLMQSALNMAIGHVAAFATAGTAVR